MSVFGDIKKKAEHAVEQAVDGATKASIDFRNETAETIHVVMDTDREAHDIAPHGQATFSQAHVGDKPTFRVSAPGGPDKFSRQVGNVGLHASFGWNGTSF